ncbi:MAG: hypothetical protein A2X49_05550 [Lentisphaerae bacterium GWF2_52_8]|nr:MAG: hypothetical protein A2X49_05550 [Lentisphaerae bacterium GWF2_52_8]
MSTKIIMQARMSSSRLPGKVLMDIHGRPMLSYLFEGLAKCKAVDGFLVATSLEPSDDPVAEFCKREGVGCFRGDLRNVAQRFLGAIKTEKLDSFVRICADSPLLDYRIIEKGLSAFRKGEFDLVTNVQKRTYPRGMSVEVLDAKIFCGAYREFSEEGDFEHVTKFFYRHPERFRIFNFENEPPLPVVNLSVDTPEDMALVKEIIGRLDKPHWEYTAAELVELRAELAGKDGTHG